MSDYEGDYPTYFVGPCTCEHEPEEHGWGLCGQKLPDGSFCPCEAGWEE